MANQYEVLGKAPTAQELKNLSPDDIHLTIKNLNARYGKWKYFIILIYLLRKLSRYV